MTYDGYEALVTYGEDAELLHGDVMNLRDVITFQGRSVGELKQAFAESVTDYLAFCRERGEEPEKALFRPRCNRSAVTAAKRAGLSLNKWVATALEQAIDA
jgi:predicted HicB family RNase H-like nuclease